MIAIDRSYLDISARIQKVEDNRLPSFQINPLTSFTPIPWDQCGYGLGGSWSDPCGYEFDNSYDFQNWCNRNRFDAPIGYGQIDFSINRLLYISAGDYGIGFGLRVGNVFASGQLTVVQVERNGVATNSTQRSYVLAAVNRQSKNVVVEYIVGSDECYLGNGMDFPLATSGTMVVNTQADYDRLTGKNWTNAPEDIQRFNYAKNNLGVAYLGNVNSQVNYTIDRVAYRGPTAMVYVRKTIVVGGGVGSLTRPYFAFKLPKKVTGIKVIDVSN